MLNVKAESAGVLGSDVYFNSLLLTAQHNIPVGPLQIFGGLRGCTLALGLRVSGVMAFGAITALSPFLLSTDILILASKL